MTYAALLDANVLVPVVLTDTLLALAVHDLYRPLWSSRILDEVAGALARVRPDVTPAAVRRRLATMATAFPDACVTRWEPLVGALVLPDAGDRHVVAAALAGGAGAIVTHNVRDFPPAVLHPLGVTAVTPDDFLLDLLDLAEEVVRQAVRDQAARRRRPPTPVRALLAELTRAGVPRFAAAVGA